VRSILDDVLRDEFKYEQHIPPERLLSIWGETMEKEFEMMIKGFDAAQDYTRKHHAH